VPATAAFGRVRQHFLAFVDEILPKWPILCPEQVLDVFRLHHNCVIPNDLNDITPGYRVFSFIVALGNLVCHLKNPLHGAEYFHRAHWPVFSVYTRGPQEPLVEMQLRALDLLHARYTGSNSQPQFMSLAKSMPM